MMPRGASTKTRTRDRLLAAQERRERREARRAARRLLRTQRRSVETAPHKLT